MKKIAFSLLVVLLAGCGGGHGSFTPTASGAPTSARPGTGSQGALRMQLTIPAPNQGTSQSARRAQYVSSATQGVLVQVYASSDVNHTTSLGASATDVSSGSPACQGTGTPRTCTIYIPAPPTTGANTEDFVVTAYAQTPTTTAATPAGEFAGDTALSTGMISQSIVSGAVNTINVSLAGVPAKLNVTFQNTVPSSGPVNVQATVVPLDAAGNTIVGAFSAPVTFSWSDPSGALNPASNSVTLTSNSPANTISFTNTSSGTNCTMTPVTFTATVGGASIGTATYYSGVSVMITDYSDAAGATDMTLRNAVAFAPTGGAVFSIGSSSTAPQTIVLASQLSTPNGSTIVICGANDGNPADLTLEPGPGSISMLMPGASGTSSLTLENLTMKGGSGSQDTMVNVASGTSIELDHVMVNVGTTYGITSSGSVVLNHSVFTGSTIYVPVTENAGTLTVNGSSFYNNQSLNEAGAIDISTGANATITNSTFANNEGQSIGAIFLWGTLSVVSSTFVDNTYRVLSSGAAYAIGGISGNLITKNSIYVSSGAPNFSENNITSGGYNLFSQTGGGGIFQLATDKVASSAAIGTLSPDVYNSFLELVPIPNTSSVGYDMIPAASCSPSTDGDYPPQARPLNGTTCSAGALEYSPTGSY